MAGDLLGMARQGMLEWTRHRYLRTIGGHKQMRTVEVAAGKTANVTIEWAKIDPR